MNVSGHYRYSSCLDEQEGCKRQRFRPTESTGEVESLIEQFPDDSISLAIHERNQASTTIRQLRDKATQIEAVFAGVISRYPAILQHQTFSQNVVRLQQIQQYCLLAEQNLQQNVDKAPLLILSQREQLVTDLLWMNNQELVTAHIVSELDR